MAAGKVDALERIQAQLNALGPAKLLAALFGVKAGQGPRYVVRELVPTIEAFLRDPELRQLYGIIEWSASGTQGAVAAQNSGFQVGAVNQFLNIITFAECEAAGNSFSAYLGFNFGYATADQAFPVDLRLWNANPTVVPGGTVVAHGTNALAPAGKIQKMTSPFTLAGPLVLPNAEALPATFTASSLFGVQCNTVNIGMDFTVRGYLVPIKAR